MTLDEVLLAELRATVAEVADRKHDLEVAEAKYRHGIRRLHAAGGSVREIAKVLDLSHQRVAQLVNEAGGTPGRRRSKVAETGLLDCSFCAKSQTEVAKLIAGPGCYICDGCVAAARARLDGASPGSCSFCGKSVDAVDGGIAPHADGADIRICQECLTLCDDILAEELPT